MLKRDFFEKTIDEIYKDILYLIFYFQGEPYFDNLGIGYLIQVPAGLILALCAIFIADRRFHLGLVLLHLGYQFWWISLLFDTPTVPTIVG